MPSNEVYRAFLTVFYPLFFVLSLLSQSFVIYIIFYHSPRNLQTLKFILFNTCVFQIVHVFVCYFLQLRQVSHLVPIEIWSYGMGRHLEAFIGYSLYHVLQTATFGSGISVVMTLFLKYEAARIIRMEKWRRYSIIALLLSPLLLSITMELTLIVTQSIPADVRAQYRILNENVEEHAVIGVLNLKTVASQVNMLIMSSSVLLLPLVGLTSRSKILKHISTTADRFSHVKNTQNKIFVQGLTLQTFLPMFFYVPISSVYFFCIATQTEILFQQYFMFLIPAFPALFDPYITIYFVTPYRNRLKVWLKFQKHPKSLTVVNSQNTLS